jgi:gas vesicle protein
MALSWIWTNEAVGEEVKVPSEPSLEELRVTMDKWIETQQIIAKERNEWQQGNEILRGRLDLVKTEIGSLEEKITQAKSSVEETDKKRNDLLAENDQLKATSSELTEEAAKIEEEIRRLVKRLPEPLQSKLQPLYQRIPSAQSTVRVSAAERFQNVLGIVNELNKANTEITVSYEVHNLAGGKPSEVKAIYVGLAQGYYVSAGGEGGVGSPGDEGWLWNPMSEGAGEVLKALEIIQGKETPAFVAVPVKIQ